MRRCLVRSVSWWWEASEREVVGCYSIGNLSEGILVSNFSLYSFDIGVDG